MKAQDQTLTRIAAVAQARTGTDATPTPSEIALAFDDNRLASIVFGHYDQNIARIERRLGVTANANGNQILIRGPKEASEQARRVFEMLYERAKLGQPAGEGDVEGVDRGNRLSGNAVSRRTRAPRARRSAISRPAGAASCGRATPRRTAISPRCASTNWCSPKGRPAPARPGSPSGTRSRCSSRGSSSAWCFRAPRSRRASGSASCPAT